MRLGLVYLPDEVSSQRCVELSQALVRGREARVVLGEGRWPHVTLLHVETAAAAAELWAEAKGALPATLPLAFAALAFLPYERPYNAPATMGAAPATMAYVIVPCTAALRSAEERALALPFVQRAEVTTGNGDRFMPHVTAALWEGEVGPEQVLLGRGAIEREVSGTLALGVIGAHGVYARTLFGG